LKEELNMSDPITVMIVDDHEMVRHGASGYLEAQPDIEVVAEAESGEEAVRLAREHVPHVVWKPRARSRTSAHAHRSSC
jgi:CheY-like chemotaxis protein